MHLREMGWSMDWIDLAQDRDMWWPLVDAVMNLLSLIKRGKFLDYLRTCYVLKVDSAPRSSVPVLRFMSIPFAVQEA
jgi:hypothetical protein